MAGCGIVFQKAKAMAFKIGSFASGLRGNFKHNHQKISGLLKLQVFSVFQFCSLTPSSWKFSNFTVQRVTMSQYKEVFLRNVTLSRVKLSQKGEVQSENVTVSKVSLE